MTWFRKLRSNLDRYATRLWGAVFYVLARLGAKRGLWQPVGNQRVLVIAPHPDDEALGCGGTIIKHVAAGDSVDVAVVTDGRQSRAQGLSPDEMARVRRREADAAAERLGVRDLHWLDFREGDWRAEELEARLDELISDLSPAAIYGPCWLDYHPEHRKVAECLARVIPADGEVRVYTLHVPLGRLANFCVDVSRELRALAEVFRIYESQQASLMRGLRLREYAAAWHSGAASVEEFCSMSGQAYRRAHSAPPDGLSVRGIRYRSFTDPASYFVGGRARRILAKHICDR